MMTETELEVDFLSGTYNTRENKVVGEVILDNMREIGPVDWTEEEKEFAWEMRKSLSENAFQGILRLAPKEYREEMDDLIAQPLCDRILPPMGENVVLPGSTDVADVSWNVPCAQFSVATQIMGSPGHSWQNVACGRMGIGKKGMLMAAKVLATTAFDLINSEKLRDKAWEEFNKVSEKNPYQSPFPENHKPPFHRLKPDILQYSMD
jgi:aminobenzoyl-glutamate utilization protein B